VPEGDTLHRAAGLLRVLEGVTVSRLEGSHRAVIAHRSRIEGHAITSVEARGKHLVITFDHDWALRTHLGMTGSWHRYRPGERWRITPGKARVVITTDPWVAVCFAASTVQLDPTADVHAALAHLGPDLIHDEVDWDEVTRRARRSRATTVADLLLDQRVMAGIGNVYKSETLYLQRIHPETPAQSLADEQIRRCGERAQRLMMANLTRPRRSTTGQPGRGAGLWVYGRAGSPCRRCRTEIEMTGLPADERLTYWCPSCQPAP
jgi:endonuclease-8